MALFSGKNPSTLDYIAGIGSNRLEIEKIYAELGMYRIGELKFTSNSRRLSERGLIKKYNDIWSWNKNDYFDGWVYANGEKFSISDWPDAASEYGGTEYFQVPDLRDRFVKGVGSESISYADQKSSCGQHQHVLTDSDGTQAQFKIDNGFVFCAAGNWGGYRKQNYYTHPATLSSTDGGVTTFELSADHKHLLGTVPVFLKNDPNWPKDEYGNPLPEKPDDWCIKYTVPALHTGSNDAKSYTESWAKSHKPWPLDMHLTMSDLATMLENGETSKTFAADGTEITGDGQFRPESTSIVPMIYIGMKSVAV